MRNSHEGTKTRRIEVDELSRIVVVWGFTLHVEAGPGSLQSVSSFKPPMKLSSIRIRRFKAVCDSGSINLGARTAFVGYNGTSKSSVLETFGLHESWTLGPSRWECIRRQLLLSRTEQRSRLDAAVCRLTLPLLQLLCFT